MKKVIRGGTIVSESAMYDADILIDGEKIEAIGRNFEGIADAEGRSGLCVDLFLRQGERARREDQRQDSRCGRGRQ